MAYEDAVPGDAGRRSGRCSVRLPTNVLIVFILSAVMFTTMLASMAFCHGCTTDSSDEGDGANRATSEFVMTPSFKVWPSRAYLGEEITFWANATSTASSTLTVTIFFDYSQPNTSEANPDSGISVNITGNPANVVQKFTYSSLGNFTIPEDPVGTYLYPKVYFDDGTGVPGSNVSKILSLCLMPNSAPEFVRPLWPINANLGQTVNLSVSVMDPDGDPIDILWEFGDGTFATNATNGSYEDRFVNQTHVWNPEVEPGLGGYTLEFIVNVTATDSFGNNFTSTNTAVITVLNNAPAIAITSSSTEVEPGEPVIFYANATDEEGDPLTWIFNYSDGTVEVVHTDPTEPGTLVWCNMTHAFDEPGNYTVRMNVSDALGDNQVFPHNKSASVDIIVALNVAPAGGIAFDVRPNSLIINATIGFLDIILSYSAWDPDGDIITVSWYINDAADPVVNVSSGGTDMNEFVQVLTVTEPGNYNASVVVTDGYEDHEYTITAVLFVTTDNMPPRLKSFNSSYAYSGHAVPDEEVEFMIWIYDREHDPVEVIIDFGDDSPVLHFNLTEYVDRNATYNFTHAYQYSGVYNIHIWFSDNKIGAYPELHTKEATVEFLVREIYVAEAVVWDWWDYTSLGMVFAIPAMVAVRMVIINRRMHRLEREGLTLEEARIKNEAMLLDRLLKGGDGGA